MGERRSAEREVGQPIQLDVSREVASASDEALVFDSAHASADVGSHDSYNKSLTAKGG